MANNKIQIKRTTVSGRVANTTDSANTTFIDKGELAFNLADRKLFSSDSANALFEVGSNLTNLAVNSNIIINNDGDLRFKTINGNSVYFTQQSDDNFVFYSTNTAGGARAVFNVFGNSTTSNLQINIPLQIAAGVVANNTLGVAGQVLTSNGTTVYWASPGAVSGLAAGDGLGSNNSHYFVNVAYAFTWTNTHTFNANVAFKDDIALENANAIYFNSLSDANWRMGRATGAYTKWFYTGNTIDIIVANSPGEGFSIGLVGSNSYFETGYRGTFVANSITIGSGTSNTIISNNTITTTGISTTNVSASGNVTADIFVSTNNGQGTNFKIGDDAWIGDINIADTFRVMGQQSANNGYIVFGNGDANTLGRAGVGPLTYTGNFTANNINAVSFTVGATTVANSTGVYATQLGGQTVTALVSNSALQGYGYLSNAAAQTTYLSNAAAVVTYVSNASLQGYAYISNAAAQTTFLSNAAARTTYLSNAAAVTTYLSNAAAVVTFVSNSALTGYNYINATSAVSNSALQGYGYLSNAAAVTTFVSNSALTGYNYINATTAATTYLSNAAAVTTYASNASLQGYGYLSNAAAVTIFTSNAALQGYGYLSNAAAQTTYLSNAAAVTTYVSNSSLQGYGYLSNAAAVVTFVSNSALQGYNLVNTSGSFTLNGNTTLAGTNTRITSNALFTAAVVINGDLTVQGTTTYVNAVTLNIGDNIITLNADLPADTAPTQDAGIEVDRGSSANVQFIWDETNDRWSTNGQPIASGNSTVLGTVNATAYNVGATVVANTTGVYATQLSGQTVTNLVSNSALQGYGYLSNAAAVTTFLSNAAAVTTYVSNASLQGYGYLSNAAAVVTFVSNSALQGYGYLSNAAAVTTFVSNAAFISGAQSFTGQKTFSANTTFNANAIFNAGDHIVLSSTSGISANSTFGTAGQILVSTGSAVYWGTTALSANNADFLDGLHGTDYVSNSALQTYGYLSNAAAVVTFVSNASLQGYGYLSNAAAQTTYLSNAAAVTTYVSNSALQGYGYLSNAAAVVTFVSNSALQGYGYLSNAAAVTTFVSNAAFISGAQSFTGQKTFGANTTFNANAVFNGGDHIVLSSTSGISANSTFGVAGQVLTTTGSAVYWSSAGVNTAAQYAWTNTHTFSANVTMNATTTANNLVVSYLKDPSNRILTIANSTGGIVWGV